MTDMQIAWRGVFANAEVNTLHAEAFDHGPIEDDWTGITARHSIGWVTARDEDGRLIGFVNVIGDGTVHAWIQDTMVAPGVRRRGIGLRLVETARDGAREAGCEWLHVDYDADLREFYRAAGFRPTEAGLIDLTATPGDPV